jgi:hypothetical protein
MFEFACNGDDGVDCHPRLVVVPLVSVERKLPASLAALQLEDHQSCLHRREDTELRILRRICFQNFSLPR